MKAILKIDNFSNYEIYPKEGKIWSLKQNKFIGSNKNPKGYWQVHIYDDNGKGWNTKLHRVIYTACYGDIPMGLQVNHIDENKDNNSIFNLNLMSCKENVNWGTRNKRAGETISKVLKGKPHSEEHKKKNALAHINNIKISKPVGAYKNGELVMSFPSVAEASRNNYHNGAICDCCNGKRKTHKGYEWRYID